MTIAQSIRESIESGSWIREMFEVGERLKIERGAENVFDFSLGNPILDPPEKFHKELSNIINNSDSKIHIANDNSNQQVVISGLI